MLDLSTASVAEVREALNQDFDGIHRYKEIHKTAILIGENGIEGFLCDTIYPFLDRVSDDRDDYGELKQLLSDFRSELAFHVTLYKVGQQSLVLYILF